MLMQSRDLLTLAAVALLGAAASAEAAFDLDAVLAEQFPPSTGPFMGDWEGEWSPEEDKDPFLGAQIIGRGNDTYEIHLTPAPYHRCEPYAVATVKARDGKLTLKSGRYEGTVTADAFTGRRTAEGKSKAATFAMKRVVHQSPTLGLAPPEGAVVLFDGTSLDAFEINPEGPWGIRDGHLLSIAEKGKQLVSKQKFLDVSAHVEFLLPYLPDKTGQERGNGGVFFQGEFEVQVLDSYGLPGYFRECGALYKVSAPKVNMCYPPNVWQTYDIDYTAPRFDAAGKQTALARITVRHNGKLIHTDEEIPFLPTNSYKDRIKPHPREPGPFEIQAHGNHVQYRNIWLVEK